LLIQKKSILANLFFPMPKFQAGFGFGKKRINPKGARACKIVDDFF